MKMSGRLKLKAPANSASNLDDNVNERILSECHGIYTDKEKGLVQLAGDLGLPLLPPRKKITVMLMGNHSAGKSSFINWYVEEHIQRTGVAIETQGFTFITSGRKRESLTGNATLHLYPHFQKLQDFTGVADYLSTEISSSRQKKFSLVTFIDTPGLVDGDMKYEFDVEKALIWLGDQVDLIFVFFDPMGQALCKRTLNIVEKLNEKNNEKLRFYLSKADEVPQENDRQRVMMQIVQELCKRPGLNKCGFDMPTIYIPDPAKPSRCLNQIDEVCQTIEKTINQTVQNTLNHLEQDAEVIAERIDVKLAEDSQQVIVNRNIRIKHWLFGFLGYILPFFYLSSFLITYFLYDGLAAQVGEEVAHAIFIYVDIIAVIWGWLAGDNVLWGIFVTLNLSLVFILLSKFYSGKPTLSRKEKRKLRATQEYIQEVVKPRKMELYAWYLQQCISDYDLS
ncbi:sarcalumenin-like isoform X2 [Erpetoichthys calabaricus]|uniref:sarcalumenin-like isoform X2 n=1 Tax=Erpetoichthys calabaricus TaxID=27687 RepID=UPI00109FB678|nr:sarcalumenin-like isoform X2 [Erpetoichthys calabaricus]